MYSFFLSRLNLKFKLIKYLLQPLLLLLLFISTNKVIWDIFKAPFPIKQNVFEQYIILLVIRSKRERNVLFNDALNTFYLRLYSVRHMVKDHSDSEEGNLLPPHRLLLSINSKGSFICTILQTG